MDKDGVFLTIAVLPLAIKYTVVAKWRSPADGVAGLGGLTVQAHCLSGYSHYPPPQPPAQLSLHQGGILWLTLENGNGAGGCKDVSCGRLPCDLVTTVSSDTKTSLCACCRFLYGLGQGLSGCVRTRSLYFIHMYLCGDG